MKEDRDSPVLDEVVPLVRELLLEEPCNLPELAERLGKPSQQVYSAIKFLKKIGEVSQNAEGSGRCIHYFIRNTDYGKYVPLTTEAAQSKCTKRLLDEAERGPVWLPSMKSDWDRESLRIECELLADSGVFERYDFQDQEVLYAKPGTAVESLEKKLVEVACFRRPAVKAAAELAEKGPFVPLELVGPGISLPAASRAAYLLQGYGALELKQFGHNYRVFARPGTPELDLIEKFAERSYPAGKEIIRRAKSGPFTMEDICKSVLLSFPPKKRYETLYGTTRFLEETWGILGHVLAHGPGDHKGTRVCFLSGESDANISSYLESIGKRRKTAKEIVDEYVGRKKPFSVLDIAADAGAVEGTVRHYLQNLQKSGELSSDLSPAPFYIPEGTSAEDIKSYRTRLGALAEKVPELVGNFIDSRVSSRTPFTEGEILDTFPEISSIGVAMRRSLSKHALGESQAFTEKLYVPEHCPWEKVSAKADSLGLDFSDDWKARGQYVLVTYDREKIADNISISRARVDSSLKCVPDGAYALFVDVSGAPVFAKELEKKLAYQKVAMSRFYDGSYPSPADYVIVGTLTPEQTEDKLFSVPGIRSRTRDSHGLFAAKPFDSMLRAKFLLVEKAIDTLSALANSTPSA